MFKILKTNLILILWIIVKLKLIKKKGIKEINGTTANIKDAANINKWNYSQ